MPSWYRRECWRVSCDLPALEGSLYTCGRQTIFQRYDISVICPQDMSCSVCLIARGYDWLNRKCWKKSAAHSTPPGRPPQARLIPGWVEICTVLVTVAGRAAAVALFLFPVTLSFRCHHLQAGQHGSRLQPRSPLTRHPSAVQKAPTQPDTI